MQEIIKKLDSLRNQIRKHEYLYYIESNPEISDTEFDRLLKELETLESQHPELITPDSPTQRVGGAVTSFERVKHRVPMMSIANSYSLADIADWIERCEKNLNRSPFPVVAELKIDGISGSFNYNQGKLVLGATRGDGIEGDIITTNVKTIRSLPLSIESKLDLDIRGEIYTPKSVLAKLNEKRAKEGLEPFKNCRNLTSGTVKSLDPAVAAERQLEIMVYGIAQAKELSFKRHSEALSFLKEQGFKLNQAVQICHSMEEIKAFIEKIDIERKNFRFDIDGIVFKVDDLDKQEELGTTAKAPRWVIAYKFPQPRAKSRLLSVEWQVGRSRITPVACLEPVELCGTTVSRASLHNIDQIRGKDIRLGDLLLVEKAAYIIPYVVEPLIDQRTGNEKEIQIPERCPICNGKLTVAKDNEDDTSTTISCNNPDCFGVKARRTTHFINQMEIENFGPQLVDRLLEQNFIKQPEDILSLTEAQLASVDRMGLKSASKIIQNIKTAANKPLYRVISGFGISNVGAVVSESIARAVHQSFDEFLNINLEKLKNIEGIQEKIATNIIEFINAEGNKSFISAIKDWWHGPSAEELASNQNTKLDGKSFVVTGEAIVPRRKLEELIKSSGGQIKSSVSVKTDYLLIGSLEGEDFVSTKKTKAIQLSKPIISEFELYKMLDLDPDSIKAN